MDSNENNLSLTSIRLSPRLMRYTSFQFTAVHYLNDKNNSRCLQITLQLM